MTNQFLKSLLNKFLFLIVFIVFSNHLIGQTKFKNRVIIKVEATDSSSGAKPRNPVESSKTKYKIFEVIKAKEKDTLKIKGKSVLKSTREKTIEGVKYESIQSKQVVNDSFVTGDKTKNKSKELILDAGKYNANISISKDSLLINFWLPKNYYNRKTVRDKSKYHPNKKYFISLKNRQYVSFPFKNYEIAALTIPFKYHFGFTENDTKVDPDFTTNINVSGFFGKRLGKVRYTYDKYKGMIENRTSVTVGLFLGLGSQKIDSTSTSLSSIPLTKEMNVPVLSYGMAGVLDIRNFNFGLFLGLDSGLGSSARRWNYHDRLWLGFGFGYKVAILGKEE